MEHGAASELNTSQPRHLAAIALSKPRDGYRNGNFLIEYADVKWPQREPWSSWLYPECIFEKHETVSSILKCVLICDGHCAHLLLEKSNVLYLNNMV